MKHTLSTIRHSLSHVMAQAVKSIYGENVKLAIGPDIDNGFYYDFDFGEIEFKEENLKELEKKMKNIIKQNQLFEEYKLPIKEATDYLKSKNEDYKVEMAEDLKNKGETELTFYRNKTQQGVETFVDMCCGPHVDKTLDIDENGFKLERIAGAYWKGNSDNKMLTRIYGFAFENREKLDEYIKLLEEARKRDHKIIGKKLDLFSFHPESPGFVYWHENGMAIWNELEKFGKSIRKKYGYVEIKTPQMAKNSLWITSGHWDHYKDDMFVFDVDEETWCMKPMDCPFDIKIYQTQSRSYRELPIRYTEIGRVFRNEKSGQLNGLFRVREISQDDSHLFLTEDQIEEEITSLLKMVFDFYSKLDLEPKFFLSTRPDDFMGEIATWDTAENDLKKSLESLNINYGMKDKDGAFYGPKIDVNINDAMGRSWQVATIQLDFQLPGRFECEYVDSNGQKKTPVMIHAAVFGSFERMTGILIEHFSGIFPLWLAPRQAIVVPVGEDFEEYGKEILAGLQKAGIRANLDNSSDSLNKKVRNAEQKHINYILVVGEKESQNKSVSVRNYKTKEQSEVPFEEFLSNLKDEIEKKVI